MAALDRHVEHVLIHTGQNYDHELNQVFFDELEIRKPDFFLGAVGEGAADTIGRIISLTDKALAEIQPDAVLILGDTNSCLAAISAKRRKIPVFHMEAGNRCFDQRVPEEINRVIVDHISDINLPYSSISREYLLREGLPPDRVIKTGSPMFEVIQHYRPSIDASTVLTRLDLTKGEYYVVSCHREENIEPDKQFAKLIDMLNALADQSGRRVIVSTHPRTRKRIEGVGATLVPGVELLTPLGFPDYVHLQVNAKACLSDSGTITEEASILGFDALNLRDAHERPEGMEEAVVMMTGLETDRVLEGLSVLESLSPSNGRTSKIVEDYDIPNVSDKVVRIILSYTDYINRVVWHKQ